MGRYINILDKKRLLDHTKTYLDNPNYELYESKLMKLINNLYMSDKIFEIYPHNFNKDKLKVEFQDSDPQEFMKTMGKWRRSYKVGEYGNYLKDFYSKLVNGHVGVGYYHLPSGEKKYLLIKTLDVNVELI